MRKIHEDGNGFENGNDEHDHQSWICQYTNACTCREGDADITSVVGEDTTILAWVPRMRVDKYWFENFFPIESQNLETQS